MASFFNSSTMFKPLNILIIDDEADFCQLISLFLKRKSYATHCVHCLKDAEIHLYTHKPQVILLDHNLPDGLGLNFLIDNTFLFHYSHVILITADPSPHIKANAFEAGVHFLGKPFEMKKIKEMIALVA